MSRKKTRECEKCGAKKNLTKHHILPRRHFGVFGQKIDLCRRCHDELELRIPFKKLKQYEYYRILNNFLNH